MRHARRACVLARPPGAAPRASIHSKAILTHPVAQVLDSTLWNREFSGGSEDVVGALVHQLFAGIRDHLVQSAEMKFNCFFLMPLIDTFPARLREELEAAYEADADLAGVFDVASVRTTRSDAWLCSRCGCGPLSQRQEHKEVVRRRPGRRWNGDARISCGSTASTRRCRGTFLQFTPPWQPRRMLLRRLGRSRQAGGAEYMAQADAIRFREVNSAAKVCNAHLAYFVANR